MAQNYLTKGFRLDLDRGTKEWRVFYFESEKELHEFIRDNDLKNKFETVVWDETFIPDLKKRPRFYVMLRLKDGSHIHDEFYTEKDLNEFLDLYRGEGLSPIENYIFDREKNKTANALGCSTWVVLIFILVLGHAYLF